jgi:tetratricopeptide (TPR) repeat protein
VAIEDEVLKPYQEYYKKCQRYEQVLVEAIKREPYLSNDTQNELKRLQRVLKLRDEDIAQIEAQITSQNKAIQPSVEPAEGIQAQTLLRRDDVAPVKPTNEAVAASQAETPTPPRIRLPRMPAISVPVLRNPKLLIGAGITTAVALTFIFLIKTPQPGQKVEPAPTASATVSSAAQTSAQDFYVRGDKKLDKKDYKGAIEDFNQAIQLNPDLANAYFKRGNAKSSLDDNTGAIADYNQALKLDPGNASIYFYRGLAKDNQEAIADFNQALKLDPGSSATYCARGNAKYWLEDYQGAIADFDLAIKLNPDYANAYYSRGIAKSDLGDKQGAIAFSNNSTVVEIERLLTRRSHFFSHKCISRFSRQLLRRHK